MTPGRPTWHPIAGLLDAGASQVAIGTGAMILTGEHYGALCFSSLDDFYPLQRRAAAAILAGVHTVAAKTIKPGWADGTTRGSRAHSHTGPDEFERPHHAFVIDGARGTGKTTLLLTIEKFLASMTLDCGRGHPAVVHDGSVLSQLASLDLRAPPGASGTERVALVLPIVFTEDMEATETTMEAIFAQMDGVLEREHGRADAPRKEILGKLRDDLRREVGVAWTFSRRIGSEALSNDALDYTDFVVRRAKHNRQAYDRIHTWRDYVARFLDELGFRTLVLMFDDSDLDPTAAEDILGAIRMYLSHPRIVSVMAVEMATLQRTVFSRNLASLGQTPTRLLDFDGEAAQGMVDGARRNADALLDKVLPVNLRHRLTDVDMRHLDHFFRAQAGAGVGGFARWCVHRFEEADEPRDKLSWWLLAKPYRRLVADNVRRIVAFRDEAAVDGPDPVPWLVRNHGTHDLPTRDGLDLHEIEIRIEAGEIVPDWQEDDDEEGDDAPIVPADRDLSLIEFWLDLAIADRGLDVVGSDLIRHWLPSRGMLGSEEFLSEDGYKSLGVAGVLRDAPLPRSCLYVYQFRRLSGVLVRTLPERTHWVSWLVFTSGDLDWDDVVEAAMNVALSVPSDPRDIVGWLRSQAVLVMSNTYRKAATLKRPAMEFVVGLYALEKAQSDMSGFSDALSALDEDDPAHDGPTADRGRPGVGDFKQFLSTLRDAYVEAERTRQEALFAWACALEIATLGDDDQRPHRPSPRRHLAVSFAPSSSPPRLPDLMRLTVDRLSVGGRHALLLAWSLVPLLPVLHGFGGDYDERGGTSQSWEELGDAFRLLRATITPVPNRHPAAIRSPEDTRGRAVPVAGSWDYPEFTRTALEDIVSDVVRTTKAFKQDLRPGSAAGTMVVDEQGPDPVGRLAWVLGTSRRWASLNLVRP